MLKLLFQGHGSYRLTSDDNRIIYVDPYKGKPGESIRKKAGAWNAPNKLIVEPGQEITLEA